MEASATKNRSQQTTPQKKVLEALSPDDAEHLILKNLVIHKLEITADETKRLIRRLVRTSEALEANCLIEYNSTICTNNPINLKKHSNQNFMESLVCESGKQSSEPV
jgi:hypothetical protein